jgi:hypothetical protein
MHYFSHLFDEVLYMFRTGTLSIIMSISTLYTCNSYLSYSYVGRRQHNWILGIQWDGCYKNISKIGLTGQTMAEM